MMQVRHMGKPYFRFWNVYKCCRSHSPLCATSRLSRQINRNPGKEFLARCVWGSFFLRVWFVPVNARKECAEPLVGRHQLPERRDQRLLPVSPALCFKRRKWFMGEGHSMSQRVGVDMSGIGGVGGWSWGEWIRVSTHRL